MATKAQFRQFGPFFDASGALVTSPHIYHYVTGTSTLKDGYTDRDKNATIAQPLVGSATGVAAAWWDGVYKLVVKTSDDATTLFTWDGVDMTVDEQQLNGTLVWDPANLADGTGETSASITVTGAAFGDYVDVAAPYDLQGILAHGYVSASDTVKIRIQNETGGAIDLASGTWGVRVRKG